MICLGRKDGQSLKGEGPGTCSSVGFYWVNLHRNTGHICKAHQSLSGSNDQIIDNIQRTMRAYLESGSDKGPLNFGGTNSFHAWTLII